MKIIKAKICKIFHIQEYLCTVCYKFIFVITLVYIYNFHSVHTYTT